MTIYLGDFPTGKTIYVPFHTFNSSGASVTITGLAVTDIEIYRNGSVTQRASDAGYALLDTDGIDFDGLTGIHGFSIDTSDNTDAGFYAAGYDYWVVVSAITVDSQTVSFVAATFSIDNRQLLRPTVASRTLDVSAGGEAGVDWANVGSPTTTLNLSGTSTKALEPTTAGRTLDVTTTGEAGLDFANVNLPVGSIPIGNIIENGTMQAGSAAGTAVLRSATSFVDDLIIGATIIVTGGTGAGQSRIIYDWVSTTDTASVSPNWTTTPDNTSTYLVIPTPPASTNSATLPAVNVTQLVGDSQSATDLKDFADAGYDPATNKVQGVVLTDTVTTYTGNTVQSGDAFARLGAPAGASIAADIAVIESQTDDIGVAGAGLTALATQASVNTIDDFLDTEVAAILAAVDTEVAAIKAKTDQLTFTKTNELDANVQSINGATVTGDGNATSWDGA